MKEIIISVYDSGWEWSIVKYEDDKYYKSSNENSYATLYYVDKMIYDSQIIYWSNEGLTQDDVVKKLAELGYERVIICKDGDIEVFKNDAKEVFKSRVNGIIFDEGVEHPEFILTCEDRTTKPPHLQCYQYKQYVYSTCWALTKEELKPYKEEISFGDYY